MTLVKPQNHLNTALPEFIMQLSQGCATQARVANRFWLALAFVSLLAVMPRPVETKVPGNHELDLPFGIGKVESTDFYPLATALMCILVVGFGSAHIQSIRSIKLIQRAIEALQGELILPGNIYFLDAFDNIVTPSINRVAPIAQVLQGDFQFYPKSYECPKWKILLSAAYYILLKILTTLVLLLFPVFSLVSSFNQGGLVHWDARPWNIHVFFFWFATAVALLILFQLLIMDSLFMMRALKRIAARWTKK